MLKVSRLEKIHLVDQVGNSVVTAWTTDMMPVRRSWLFAAAQQLQVLALEPRLGFQGAHTVSAEVRALVPAPKTELEKLILDGFIYRLCGTVEGRTELPRRGPADIIAAKVKNYLDSNFRNHITYAALSRHFCRNPQYLETRFKTCYRISIRMYLTRLRLETASSQIRAGDKVESAALSVGWTKSTLLRARHRARREVSPV